MVSRRNAALVGVDRSWGRLYRTGGWCGMVAVVPYLVAMVLITVAPPPIDDRGAETLEYIAEHRLLYLVEQVLWLAPGLLAMILLLALAVAVKDVDRGYAMIAGVIGVCSWALTLAMPITGGGSPVLVTLSDRYAQAETDERRRALAVAAEALIAENDTPALVGVLTTVGILLVSLLMAHGAFSRWTAYLGVTTGAIGVVSETFRPVIGIAYAVYGVLLLVWLAAAGWALHRLGRVTETDPAVRS
jgi:hypothetical protein